MTRPALLEALALGGQSTAALLTVTTGHHLRAAVRDGVVVRVRQGWYALANDTPLSADHEVARAQLDERHREAGRALTAVRSHRSAAIGHGWPLWREPPIPELFVPRRRRPPRTRRVAALVRARDVTAAERGEGITTPLRAVLDCAADLPFDEALAVADSALRSRAVGVRELEEAAAVRRGPRARRIRRVGELADAGAANPFESALRSIALGVPGLRMRTQVVIAGGADVFRVDLADPALRLVVEGDSYEFHGAAAAFTRDCRRYNALVAAGWTVLRIPWADAMHHPTSVEVLLRRVVGSSVDRRNDGHIAAARAAHL